MALKLKYTILYVEDVATTIDFFVRAFGFETGMQHENAYGELVTGATTLSFCSKKFLKELGKTAGQADRHAPVFEIAFETDDVASAVAKALAAGATVVASVEAEDNAEAAEVEQTEVIEPAAEVEKTEAAAQNVATNDGAAKLLADQLKAAQDDLLNARVELSRLQDKHAETLAVVEPLKEIAAKAVNNMRIACRMSPVEFGAMNSAQVLAEHAAALPTFQKQFPVGGVSSAAATPD